jgi:hypothetical protein
VAIDYFLGSFFTAFFEALKATSQYTQYIQYATSYLNVLNTPKTLNIEKIYRVLTAMQERKDVQKRNIVLKIETYEKLEKYKAKLIGKRGDSRLTFDDVINDLITKATI